MLTRAFVIRANIPVSHEWNILNKQLPTESPVPARAGREHLQFLYAASFLVYVDNLAFLSPSPRNR